MHNEWMPDWRDKWIDDYIATHMRSRQDLTGEDRIREEFYARGYAECLFNVIGWRAMCQVIGVQ